MVSLGDAQRARDRDPIGGLPDRQVDFDAGTSRLRVILGDAYLGTDIAHMWTGGPAAIEIDLLRGIEEMGER